MTQTKDRKTSKSNALLGTRSKRSAVALLLIDVINDFEFEGGDALVRPAFRAARNIAALKRRARAAAIPTIYVNDNFGRWRSDFRKIVDSCLDNNAPGKPVVELLLPDPDDYFVLKPKHSAFYATPLDLLLRYLGSKILILTGITVDNCVLQTAADAHMLEYELVIPADCVAAATESQKRHALKIVENTLNARTTRGRDLKLNVLARGSTPERSRRRKHTYD
jgi:nicotinamidase-related amidase